MTYLDRDFIYKKLELIDKYQEPIVKLIDEGIADLKKDQIKLHAAERLLQLIVDTMIDINFHIIKQKAFKPSPDLEGTFSILGQNGVLDGQFAQKLAPVVGTRNRLVHRYEEIDTDLFLENLQKNKDDFLEYARQIKTFVDKS